MTRVEALNLAIARCNALVERQLEAVEIDLLDQGATTEEVEDELRGLRRIFEAHRDRQVAAAVAAWDAGAGGVLH